MPGTVKYFGELEDHCFWGNEVKLYEHHVDKLFAMFWHKKPKIGYYVCTISKTFSKPGQHMVECTKDKLWEYIQENDDTLPLKNADDTIHKLDLYAQVGPGGAHWARPNL
ncbi:hypothetical protein ZWY2020_033080 [Hordeum vulgare]|nr:hypothetical protein ZWY2020_033080 [Hordeum vulgare]